MGHTLKFSGVGFDLFGPHLEVHRAYSKLYSGITHITDPGDLAVLGAPGPHQAQGA